MSKPLTLARLLLISTALVAPVAMAQTDTSSSSAGDAGLSTTPSAADEAAADEEEAWRKYKREWASYHLDDMEGRPGLGAMGGLGGFTSSFMLFGHAAVCLLL